MIKQIARDSGARSYVSQLIYEYQDDTHVVCDMSSMSELAFGVDRRRRHIYDMSCTC